MTRSAHKIRHACRGLVLEPRAIEHSSAAKELSHKALS